MPSRFRQFACTAWLVFAIASAPAAGSDAIAMRCFELRDSDPAAAVALADETLEADGLEPGVEIKLRTCLGRSLALTGDAPRAEAEVERVDALLAQHPMPPEFVLRALSNSGATLHTLGWSHRALDYYIRVYEAARDGDSEIAQATTLNNVAGIYSETLGAYEQAEAMFAQGQAAFERAGVDSPLLPYNRGRNLLRMGREADALARFEDAERAAAPGEEVMAHRARVERITLQASGDEAIEAAREALATIAREQQRLEDPIGEATTLVRLSGLSLKAGDPDTALAQAQQAAALVEGPAFRSEQHEALTATVAALIAGDDWRGAHDGVQALRAMEVSALRGQTLDNLAGLQARLQDTERERELQRLQDEQGIEALRLQNARKLRNVSIAAFIALLVLGGAFAWYQRGVNRRLRRLSRVDPLTDLLNRRAASHSLQTDAAAAGDGDRRDAVFLIDIDNFKARNDRYGHAAGDAALAEVARRLRACCRPDDIVARWGGEEFLVGCRQLDLVRAQQIAERLRTAMAGVVEPEEGEGDHPGLSVTIGFACFPFLPGAATPGDWQDAVALADRALYAGKHSGRDAWVGVWGHADRDVAISSVIDDPGAHAERGDIAVVASRQPVRWQAGPGTSSQASGLPSP